MVWKKLDTQRTVWVHLYELIVEIKLHRKTENKPVVAKSEAGGDHVLVYLQKSSELYSLNACIFC